jgi:cytochrome P450
MLHRRETVFCPPAPRPSPTRLGLIELLVRLKRNPLECWSEEFFQEPIAQVRLPFSDAFLVHDPHAIKRVLMDNSHNYRKDKIQRRILSSGLTANALAWSIFLLSQAPAWRSRVAEEAERELAKPTDGLADRLVVTKAVVEEALRLYPSIAALSRETIQADILGNLPVKPGSLIVISPYVLHRHRRLWSDPDAFDPSRFLPGARNEIPRFAYLPFGVGPRTCIGSSFALQEATIVLAVQTHHFEMRLPADAKVWPVQRITLRPANGLPMEIVQRT